MTHDVDTLRNFDFSPTFENVRSLAQKAQFFAQGKDAKQALIDALAICAAWPADHPMTRAYVLTYLEGVVFQGKRQFKTVTGVALFGPALPEYGPKACTQRAVTGILLEPDLAIHAESDLRTWVFGQPHATIQLWNQDSTGRDEACKWKVVANAHKLPYGLFAHPGTIREATGAEAQAFLTKPSPVHEPLTVEQLWSIPDAVQRVAKLSAESAPFWRWADAKIVGGVL
jgi:hypothetical protein